MLLNSSAKIPLETNVNVLGAKVNEITTMTISWLKYEFSNLTSNINNFEIIFFILVEE